MRGEEMSMDPVNIVTHRQAELNHPRNNFGSSRQYLQDLFELLLSSEEFKD